MFSSDRQQLRKIFFDTWRKHQQHSPLAALDAQLLEIILLHPEYHEILNDPENFAAHDFAEANPFLHMSLHVALHEQTSTDRPAGIKNIYARLCKKFSDVHSAEHQMIEVLAKILWEAQQSGKMPDEETYLDNLKKL
jgi:hypothetical protein